MRPQIEQAILEAITNLNAVREAPLDVSLDEQFIADGSKLDSFGVLTFIMGLEPLVQQYTNTRVDLLAAVSDSQNKDQFQKFGGVADFIEARL